MGPSDPNGALAERRVDEREPDLAYLCVDAYLQDIASARALATALETGVIDLLIRKPDVCPDTAAAQLGLDRRGLALLIRLLEQSQVLARSASGVHLTEGFSRALEFRDLMEMKLAIAGMGAHDLLNHFTDMVRRPEQAMAGLEFCRLFAYERCFDDTPANYQWTKRWLAITTCLTKYESLALMKHHDFGRYSSLLDVGGNSGELAVQVCRRHPGLRATVVDLPLVCRVGREHVADEPEAGRIEFVPADALSDALPRACDVVVFKSMLHDWPDGEARLLLVKASRTLLRGGSLVIFERAPLESGHGPVGFCTIPFLLFFGAYRRPAVYEAHLRHAGLVDIETREFDLGMPFQLITARKPMDDSRAAGDSVG